MSDDAFRAEEAKLATARREAEDRVLQAQTTQAIIKEDHDKLTTKMFEAVTPEDRSALQSQVAEHAEKLRNANATLQERQTEVNGFKQREVDGKEFEERMDVTATQVEKAVEVTEVVSEQLNHPHTGPEAAHGDVSEGPHMEVPEALHIEVPEMPDFALGGTSKHIGDAVAYGAHITAPYVEHVVLPEIGAKVKEFTQSVGTAPDHAEWRNVEAEIAAHEAQKKELDDFAEKFKADVKGQKAEDERDEIAVEDREHAIRVHFDAAAEDAKKIFAEQDRDSADRQAASAQDPNVRIVEDGVRERMAEEMIATRDKVTRELCRPVAELNVDERDARTLEDSAGLNSAHLERYEMKVRNEPDAQNRVDRFAESLANDQKALGQQLYDARPQAVENEITNLQGQHFPEVQSQAQALQGPGPSGPGGGGAGGGAPQQQGPAGPAM